MSKGMITDLMSCSKNFSCQTRVCTYFLSQKKKGSLNTISLENCQSLVRCAGMWTIIKCEVNPGISGLPEHGWKEKTMQRRYDVPHRRLPFHRTEVNCPTGAVATI